MVAGDAVIVKLKSPGAGRTNYQPAVGVEVAIKAIVMANTAGAPSDNQIYDGTDGAALLNTTTFAANTGTPLIGVDASGGLNGNITLMLNNSLYFSLNATVINELTFISGVQTK